MSMGREGRKEGRGGGGTEREGDYVRLFDLHVHTCVLCHTQMNTSQ